jgi:hypothetical protein
MQVTEKQRLQMMRVLTALWSGPVDGFPDFLPASLSPFFNDFTEREARGERGEMSDEEKIRYVQAKKEEIDRLIDGYVLAYEDKICRVMDKPPYRGLAEFMDCIRAGDETTAIRYVELFGKPWQKDPDFEAINKKVLSDSYLGLKLEDARCRAPKYPKHYALVAVLAGLCREEIESGRMSVEEFQTLIQDRLALPARLTLPDDYGEGIEWLATEEGKQPIFFETGALKKLLGRWGILAKGGRQGRPLD